MQPVGIITESAYTHSGVVVLLLYWSPSSALVIEVSEQRKRRSAVVALGGQAQVRAGRGRPRNARQVGKDQHAGAVLHEPRHVQACGHRVLVTLGKLTCAPPSPEI